MLDAYIIEQLKKETEEVRTTSSDIGIAQF